jgi:hypothetical protein
VRAVSTIWRILSVEVSFSRNHRNGRDHRGERFAPISPTNTGADITHWQLADGTEVGILNVIDDHSRLCLGSHARRTITGIDVVASFQKPFLSGNPGRRAHRQ